MARRAKEQKIFVLDTSVIIFSHDSILNFAEHDVGIPIVVLEELDQFKKGNDTKNFEAREFTRLLDKLADGHMLQDWIPLNGKNKGKFKVLMDHESRIDARKVFNDNKNDHKIINAALKLKEEEKDKKIILVSKDINLRLKAKSLDIQAEDYETGKIKNVNTLYTGKSEKDDVNSEHINTLFKEGEVERKHVFGRKKPIINSYFILKSEKNSGLAFYNAPESKVELVEKKIRVWHKTKKRRANFCDSCHAQSRN